MTGLCFVSAGALAHGGQEALAVAFQGELDNFDAALSGLLDRLTAGDDIRVIRREFFSAPLAELDEQFKRPEVQAAPGASKVAIAVIFPDLGEPYRAIFAKIIEGIEERAKVQVRRYPIGANLDPAELNLKLKRDGIKVAIALGRQGLKAASAMNRDIAVVVGGVLVPPETENRNLSGISLTPDPALLFARLKSMMPGIRRVIVVYDPRQNEWLIKLAREAAKTQGLELVEYEARDLASAARLYETAFGAADNRRDAVWLPQDSTTVEEITILPLVLKESWNRGVPIFSSNFLHVEGGVVRVIPEQPRAGAHPCGVRLGRVGRRGAQTRRGAAARSAGCRQSAHGQPFRLEYRFRAAAQFRFCVSGTVNGNRFNKNSCRKSRLFFTRRDLSDDGKCCAKLDRAAFDQA